MDMDPEATGRKLKQFAGIQRTWEKPQVFVWKVLQDKGWLGLNQAFPPGFQNKTLKKKKFSNSISLSPFGWPGFKFSERIGELNMEMCSMVSK